MESIRAGRKVRVALAGPPAIRAASAYGGGMGGYVRNMLVYLDQAKNAGFDYVPCYTTVRKGRNNPLKLICRLVVDLWALLRVIWSVRIVHVMGQYRGALMREAGMLLVAGFFRRPFVYEIKAGAFIKWFDGTGAFNRSVISWILRHSRLVLCEGIPDVEFLQRQLHITAHYFPNVVPASEVPEETGERFDDDRLQLLFTGYCYAGKGVFDLVRGAVSASRAGIPLELELIGSEESSFKAFLDDVLAADPPPRIQRRGVMNHDEVLRAMARADTFCMPTDHPGEGHTNTINEALMMGMGILCTRHGFLPTILSESIAYFVEKHDPASIESALRLIWEDRPEARRRAQAGRTLLQNQYVAEPWFKWLGNEYLRIAQKS